MDPNHVRRFYPTYNEYDEQQQQHQQHGLQQQYQQQIPSIQGNQQESQQYTPTTTQNLQSFSSCVYWPVDPVQPVQASQQYPLQPFSPQDSSSGWDPTSPYQAQAHHIQFPQPPYQHPFSRLPPAEYPLSPPNSSAVLTPASESSFVTGSAPSPFVYHAPQHGQTVASHTLRSMSASVVSDAEPSAPSNQPRTTFLPTPRQIRFVSTDGQPHPKRRRINAACLTCRKRKTRCSGERPQCKTCTDNGHECAGYAGRNPRGANGGKFGPDDDDEDDDDDAKDPSLAPSRPTGSSENQTTAAATGASHLFPTLSNNDSVDSNMSYRNWSKEERNLRSPESTHTAGSGSSSSWRHRVPFFRYFGPTAIVPGFKQMVVQIKDRDHRRPAPSVTGESPSSAHLPDGPPTVREPSPQEIAFYDATDPAPNAPLITHLCEMFFTHLGCNYPFLQRARFMTDLAEKHVDAILVDAVCAVAARFSSHPSLLRPSDASTPVDERGEVKRQFRGQPYAQRAASAVVDTFGCPTLAVAQACLLLAYEEFGTDRDSGLWMFLGTSIRMAQDLGIQKLEGMQLEGRMGPTPKTAKHGDNGKREEQRRADQQQKLTQDLEQREDAATLADRRASEQERIDSFWAILFLDRAVSSGVGRPVTLRDKDIEISFPWRPDDKMINGYPHPFPAMIRIVHLYGRIADVINNIKDQVTPDMLKRLTGMEKDLTGIYQRLSPKLHFNATNFQHYVKEGQGTNFILLHFWFHTLIILLHQPTLLHSLDGRIQQLFPDSRELSMSSAKTIADILAFAELIDVKSFIGNAFTSQPMYVAACAFLAEARAHASQPPSRPNSPPDKNGDPKVNEEDIRAKIDQKLAAKHSLLATAANQNYQRCYKALKLLDSYWAGCRYILTALDQKSKGLMDPILYTQEDIDGEMPSVKPSFTTPGWRRSSHGVSSGGHRTSIQWSPRMDWSQAIGWSLTGTTNSPAPNLSFLYPNPTTENDKNGNPEIRNQRHTFTANNHKSVDQIVAQPRQDHQSQPRKQTQVADFSDLQNYSPSAGEVTLMPPPNRRMSSLPYDPVSTADADLLLGLNSPYSMSSQQQSPHSSNSQATMAGNIAPFDYGPNTPSGLSAHQQPPSSLQPQHAGGYYPNPQQPVPATGFSDMLIESQDIDMSTIPSNTIHGMIQPQFNGVGLEQFNLPGGDMLPWLEYLPQDVLNYFGHSMNMSDVPLDSGDTGDGGAAVGVAPTGPGPPDQVPGQPRDETSTS